jgi:hypothetical protein
MRPVDALRTFREVLSSFFETLHRLRANLLLAPLFALAFANDQAIDIAREYSRAGRHLGDRFDFLLLTLLVSAAVPLLFIPHRLDRHKSGAPRYDLGWRLATALAVLAAFLPSVYFWAELHSGPQELRATHFTSWSGSAIILMFAGITSIVFAVLPPILFAKLGGLWRLLRMRVLWLGLSPLLVAAYVGLCVLPLLVSNEGLFPLVRSMTDRLGVFPFIGLFLLAIFSLAAYSTAVFDRWRIPVLSLLVLTAVCFSFLGLNSDFNARPLGATATEMEPIPIAGAFRKWLKSRKDYAQHRAAEPTRPYPVYLIAAAGGGAYAGFHSSYFLSRLFEICPKLRHHTFAVSGVSGGALGAALIATEARQKVDGAAPPEPDAALKCDVDPARAATGPASRRIEEFFSVDHFSFLAWARLYPDMLRRLFWFNVPKMASDTLFEEWFSANWSRISAGAYTLSLSDSVYAYWRPDSDAPALFFNVTNTQTGRAEAVSPLHYPRNLPWRKNMDMRLITAASLSFRFPLLNSPGTLPRREFSRPQDHDPVTTYDTLETTATYVDGGYYENSGLHLLNRVKAELERAGVDLNIEVRLISFNSVNQESLRFSRPEEDTLLAPINALFATRMQRGVDEWQAVLLRHGEYEAHLSLYQGMFYHHLPLGWTLSQQSMTFIKRHLGLPSDCSDTERFFEMDRNDHDKARAFLEERFPDYGNPQIRPRDLEVKDMSRWVLNMLSQRIYMGCQVGKIFRDLAGKPLG